MIGYHIVKALSKLRIPRSTKKRIMNLIIGINNRTLGLVRKKEIVSTGLEGLDETIRKACSPTMISDHLVTIFLETAQHSVHR